MCALIQSRVRSSWRIKPGEGKKCNISLPATFRKKKKEKVIKLVRAEQQRTEKKDKRYIFFRSEK